MQIINKHAESNEIIMYAKSGLINWQIYKHDYILI